MAPLWLAGIYILLGYLYIIAYNVIVRPHGFDPATWYNPFFGNTPGFVLFTGVTLYVLVNAYLKRESRLMRQTLEADVALRTALDRFPGPCALFDNQQRIRYLNQYFLSLIGKKASDTLGHSVKDVFPAALMGAYTDKLEAAIETGEPTGGEIQVAHGISPRYFVVTFVPVRHAEKGIHRVIAFAYDVSDRKYSAIRADDQRKELRQIIDMIPANIFVKDEEGRYIIVNKSFNDLHGFRLDEVVGRTAEEVWPEHRILPLISDQDNAVLVHGRTVVSEQEDVVDANGRNRTFQITKLPYRLTTDDRPALLGISVDITEKVKVEQERQVLSRLGVNLSGSRTALDVGENLLEAVQSLVPLDFFIFSVRAGRRARYEQVLVTDRVAGKMERFPTTSYDVAKDTPLKSVYECNSLLVNRTADNDIQLKPMGAVGQPSKSFMFVPVCKENKVVAVISVQSYSENEYSPKILAFVRGIADMAGPALESVRINHQKSLLGELGRLLGAARTAEEIAEIAAGVADNLIGWDSCLVGLYSSDDGTITYIYVADEMDGQRVRITDFNPIRRPVMLAQRVLNEGAFLELKEEPEQTDEEALRPPLSMLWVPIPGSEGPIGFISLQSYAPDAYDDDDLSSARSLADYCGAALERTASQEMLRYREERYRLAIESTGAAAYELDAIQKEYVFMGRQIEEMTGYPVSAFKPSFWHEIRLEILVPGFDGIPVESLRHTTKHWQCQLRIRHRNGEERWISDQSVHLRNSAGVTIGALGILRDITRQKVAELALRASEERYALAARGANDGLWDWNLSKDTIHFSDRWYQMIGMQNTQAITNPDEWFRLIHPDDLPAMKDLLDKHLNHETEHFECEVRTLHGSRSYRWMLVRGIAVSDENGVFTRIAGSQTDVTDRVHTQERLQHEAFHDSLTGLPNRAMLMEEIERRLAQIRRESSYGFMLAFMDVDRFKMINDSLGHLAGDHVLVTVAQRLLKVVRPMDVVARFAGDEFAVILDNLHDEEEIGEVMRRIQAVISEPMDIERNEIITSASIGLVISNSEYERAIDLLRDADIALYKSKLEKPGQYQVFDRSMHEEALYRMRFESDLRKARERNQLRLAFLPVLNVKTNTLDRFEALLRWEHPEMGMLRPDKFLDIAEETGLMQELDEWAMAEACRWWLRMKQQVEAAGNGGNLASVNVNLSSHHFQHRGNIATRIISIAEHAEVDPTYFGIELKENVLTPFPESTIAALGMLKDAGFKLFMDDFGVGASSIVSLHNTRFDAVKVDKRFMLSPQDDLPEKDIVLAILALAEKLGIGVIIEGVETERHSNIAREMGGVYVQGFYVSQPMTPDEALEAAVNPAWVKHDN